MPPRRAQEIALPAVNSPVLFDYSEQLAILLFGQLMKWLRPLVRRGDSIPLADLKDALWAVKEAWELHRDIARASGPQHLTAVPAEELDALTAGYDPLIEARELSVADKRRLQAHLAQQRKVAEAEDSSSYPATRGDIGCGARCSPRATQRPRSPSVGGDARRLAGRLWSRRAAAAGCGSTAPTSLTRARPRAGVGRSKIAREGEHPEQVPRR